MAHAARRRGRRGTGGARSAARPRDVMIDGGNSHYRDDLTRAARLRARGVHYVDCGTCGGVWGRERGYCLMIGEDDEPVRRLDPIWRSLAPGEAPARPTPGRDGATGTAAFGYLHCGPAGAGHFVKMVHNGVEYGMMAASRRAWRSSEVPTPGCAGRLRQPRPFGAAARVRWARRTACARGDGRRVGLTSGFVHHHLLVTADADEAAVTAAELTAPGSPRPGCGPTPPSSLPTRRRRRPGVIGDAGPEGGRRGLRRSRAITADRRRCRSRASTAAPVEASGTLPPGTIAGIYPHGYWLTRGIDDQEAIRRCPRCP